MCIFNKKSFDFCVFICYPYYMKRFDLEKLVAWKAASNRKPLIIRGARQVGKTWLMKEFGHTHFLKTAYINFDGNLSAQRLFDDNFDIDRIMTGLGIESGAQIEPDNTLIILDEIQESPKALSCLKYFYEKAPQYHIICAGSVLGVALHRGTSFPVGKTDFLDLHPMSFKEFLSALNQADLLDLLNREDFSLITAFKEKYIDLLKKYYFIGGMPEAVNEFCLNGNFQQVRHIQKSILTAYEQDFSKHISGAVVSRIRMLWNSIPSQLAKENKKFIYGVIRSGARARDYEYALTWLCDSGLTSKVHRISKPHIPLKAYEDPCAFKLFINDVGLLSALCGLDIKTILEKNLMFTEFKGALTEQYVFSELRQKNDLHICYWSAQKGTAEVDFVVQSKETIFPVEVKAEENLQSKSLKSYYSNFEPKFAIRTSMADYKKDGYLTNIPLYALSTLK